MEHTQKLSLFSALIININIMLGSGIFINTTVLTKQAGSLGAFVYLLIGIILFPLILTIAQLLHYHQESGTFYDFGRSISPFIGFLSSWSYFTAKLCSFALGVHVCLSFIQAIFPRTQVIPLLVFDCIVIVLFALLNTLNLKMGTTIQYSFIFLKMVPILFVILTGLFLAQGSSFSSGTAHFLGIPSSLPLVLYAFSGFEASCSLSRHIIDSKRNGPLAIFISFGFVLTCAFLYQLLFYAAVGPSLGTLTGGYLEAFPAFLSKISSGSTKNTLQTIMHLAIASSSLGSAYGIMYSNGWNLFTLAHNNHTFGKNLFMTLNAHGMPIACIVAEAVLAITYLLITQGNQIPLQQVSALGGTIAYTLSSCALLLLAFKKGSTKLLPIMGLLSCFILFGSFIWTISIQGPTSLLLTFIGILMFGSFMFYKKNFPSNELDVFEEL
ncbi:amino acid permease [Candidatus Dependentiae bacterium]|nr:amino acid permease [Candidatus Dependentiae bacterium]